MTKTSTVEKTCFKALWKGREAERGGCEIILADQTCTEEKNRLLFSALPDRLVPTLTLSMCLRDVCSNVTFR